MKSGFLRIEFLVQKNAVKLVELVEYIPGNGKKRNAGIVWMDLTGI